MRILFINTLYAPQLLGGAERVMQAQAEVLHRAGHEVGVLCTSAESGLKHDRVNGVDIWRAGLRNVYFHYDEMLDRRAGAISRKLWHVVDSYNFLMMPLVRKAVREFRPEVASVHNLPGWSIAVWDVLREEGIPIVQVLHDQYLLCAASTMYRDGHRCETVCGACKMLRIPHRSKSRQVDTVVGISKFVSDKLIGQGYFEGVRAVRTIPNIRDISTDAIPSQPRVDDGETVFGFIGRLSPSKGIEFLLKSMSKSALRGWKLLVAGAGEASYEESLRSEYRDPRICFLGEVTAREFYPRVDCIVIPSLWEDTFPSVAFESLLFGKPVIGSSIGGIPELLDSTNGRLFSPGDSDALQMAMQWAIDNRLRLRQETESIQKAAARFSDKERWLAEWSDVYSNAIAHRAQ